jgi:HD-GYP domain-containing protein (c-di-GMP phosphodiesterase class II)
MSAPQLRLAELLASLSLAIDLGNGQPVEWVLKSCLLTARLGDVLGLSEGERREAYYVTLLRHVGCTSMAALTADVLVDELDIVSAFALMDEANMVMALGYLFQNVGKGLPPLKRAALLAKFFTAGPGLGAISIASHCEIAERLAERLGLEADTQRALRQVFERWDGKGMPNKLKGETITLSARLASLALDMSLFNMMGGMEMATGVAQGRSGRFYDPALADAFLRRAPDLLAQLDTPSLWDAVLEAEPGSPLQLHGEQIENALLSVADFTDMKSPFLLGHSRHVADLAERAAQACALPMADVMMVRRAGLLHDIGRVGVTSAIWDKPGPLTEAEWERVRLHPNYTERIFSRSQALGPVGALAALHHERLDGSGYHRRLPATMLPPTARLLAAADAYSAMTETRPHRAALAPEAAADQLRREAKTGRLAADAVEAVLRVAGHPVKGSSRAKLTADLSPRELDVLRLIARGHTNKQMAQSLILSEKTVGRHVERLYNKINVGTRAGATLFAVQNGLLD